jgi:hypothetical protein
LLLVDVLNCSSGAVKVNAVVIILLFGIFFFLYAYDTLITPPIPGVPQRQTPEQVIAFDPGPAGKCPYPQQQALQYVVFVQIDLVALKVPN